MGNLREEISAPIIGISRHRLLTDGKGVTTLVAFHGCTLRCRYCLNPHSLTDEDRYKIYTPLELYHRVRIDELYFLATGGGITFGGGEPGLRHQFIRQFREICGDEWHITLETALNYPSDFLKELLDVTNEFIIDIKDMDVDTYFSYTGRRNDIVKQNLQLIADSGRAENCLIRVPLISEFNDDNAQKHSCNVLNAMGFNRIEKFAYLIKEH